MWHFLLILCGEKEGAIFRGLNPICSKCFFLHHEQIPSMQWEDSSSTSATHRILVAWWHAQPTEILKLIEFKTEFWKLQYGRKIPYQTRNLYVEVSVSWDSLWNLYPVHALLGVNTSWKIPLNKKWECSFSCHNPSASSFEWCQAWGCVNSWESKVPPQSYPPNK